MDLDASDVVKIRKMQAIVELVLGKTWALNSQTRFHLNLIDISVLLYSSFNPPPDMIILGVPVLTTLKEVAAGIPRVFMFTMSGIRSVRGIWAGLAAIMMPFSNQAC
jgi:hypothetical protein